MNGPIDVKQHATDASQPIVKNTQGLRSLEYSL